MRVTSNTYTNLVISSSQTEQQQLALLQSQISTGNSIQNPSDNPELYAQAAQDQTTLSQLDNYTSAANTATTLTEQNNTAMTSLHQIVAQAGEYLASVTSNMSTTDMQNIGTEMNDLVSEMTSIVNQKGSDGNYLFGGTSNKAPINTTTGDYNTGTNGETTSIEVEPGNSVQTSIAAGSSGPPATDGFLYDSATGTDVLAALKQAASDLNSGNATAAQGADVTAVNNALNLVSSYVGSTAANMSAVSLATTRLSAQTTAQSNTLNNLVQTNLPAASVQLQQLESQYQASLEAGTRVMNLSILNYIGNVTTA
jgi:flagellar hook-associated protein 3 FlgL